MIAAFFVFLGGGIGAVLRYLISKSTLLFYKGQFPLSTLLSNILSCLIVGLFLTALSTSKSINPNVKIFVLIGLCGGLSTFSTFSLETIQLLKSGNYYWAFANIFLSIIVCFGLLMIFFKKLV